MTDIDLYREQTIFTRLGEVPVVSTINELASKKHAEALEHHSLYKLASEYTNTIVCNAVYYAEPALARTNATDHLKHLDSIVVAYFDKFVADHPGINITVEEMMEQWQMYYEANVEPRFCVMRESAAPLVNYVYQKKDRLDSVINKVKVSLGVENNDDYLHRDRTTLVTFSNEVLDADMKTCSATTTSTQNTSQASPEVLKVSDQSQPLEGQSVTTADQPTPNETKIIEDLAKCVERTEAAITNTSRSVEKPDTSVNSVDIVSEPQTEAVQEVVADSTPKEAAHTQSLGTDALKVAETEDCDVMLNAPPAAKVVSSPALPKGTRKKRNNRWKPKKKNATQTKAPEGAP